MIRAVPEFSDLEDHLLYIHKVLYGLRTSVLRWHERFAGVLKELGLFQCKVDNDIWMRPNGDKYEYIAMFVDNLALVMKTQRGL